eukprot:COSAG01_NODE_3381_length_6167_cov_2.682762_2_plen_905_part_01
MQVPWIDPHNPIKSDGSVIAGDRCGLLLDCDAGTLDAYKNGQRLGNIFTGIKPPLIWAVGMDRGVALQANAITDVTEVPTGAGGHQQGRQEAQARVLSRNTASILSEICKPSNLTIVLSSETHCPAEELISSVYQLMGSFVTQWSVHNVPPPPMVVAAQHEVPKWTWGRANSAYTMHRNKLVLTMIRRPYGACGAIGSTTFRRGVHEWELTVDAAEENCWVGVATPDLPLDVIPENLSNHPAKIWWWHCSGRVGTNVDGSLHAERRTKCIKKNRPCKIRLDCDAGTLELFSPGESSEPILLIRNLKACATASGLVPFFYSRAPCRVTLAPSACSEEPLDTTELPSPFVDMDLCVRFVTRAMSLLPHDDKCVPAHDVLLVTQALSFTRSVVDHLKTCVQGADFKPFRAMSMSCTEPGTDSTDCASIMQLITFPQRVIDASKLHAILGSAIALAHRIVAGRTQNGNSVAAIVLPEIVETLEKLQTAFDIVPQMLMDPNLGLRSAARTFAQEHNCTLATAEFYLWCFGGSKDNLDLAQKQALAEFEASERQPAPDGWRQPCDEHWLAQFSDVLTGLAAECVSKLCGGLKHEEDFAVTLFSHRHSPEHGRAIASLLDSIEVDSDMTSSLNSLRQRWIGFTTPVLKTVEDFAIVAMLSHAGILWTSEPQCIETQAALLHAGKEALRVKNFVQDIYRRERTRYATRKTGEAETDAAPASWDVIAAPVLSRAKFLLQFGVDQLICSSHKVIPQLFMTDETISWEQLHADTCKSCLTIQSVRRFLLSDLSSKNVEETLINRARSVEEAEKGWNGALAILNAGSDVTMGPRRICRSSEDQCEVTQISVSGVWTINIHQKKKSKHKDKNRERDGSGSRHRSSSRHKSRSSGRGSPERVPSSSSSAPTSGSGAGAG